ncbi:MAG: bifunctional DNA primase/polymerase [Reyranella sp.]|uniref:bifunctional DNA primase/polymerase n=1 Tax=Reyranella sp. TaxID=1929291 RepID=UPI0027309481|nr:bifunctional DNA primase/polymerase [Reyranella sp.]MDP1965978.1 bifunctional DNA primase/polymerase [Reyranella sp.]MDP2374352.1 bifunctional DNA primase/polymerase [Reyranella sp.]
MAKNSLTGLPSLRLSQVKRGHRQSRHPDGMKRRDFRPRTQRVSQANGASPAAALAYLARGWSVVPLRPCEKRRLLLWELFQAEPPSASDVAGWFRRWPDANIGTITSAVSRLIVLEIDPTHGGDHSLESLERRFGALSSTMESRTAGSGRHIYLEDRLRCRSLRDDVEVAELVGSIFRLDRQEERAERHSRWPTC